MEGHIRKRSNGSYAIVIYRGKGPDGKKKYDWISVKGGLRAAQRERNRILAELQEGAYVDPSKLTVSQLLDRFMADYAKQSCGAKTRELYAHTITAHLKPQLGHLLVSKVSPLHIQGFYSERLESGRKDGKGGLSPVSVMHQHRLLHRVFELAVKWRLVPNNPVDAAESPRVEPAERPILDDEGVRKLLAAAEGTWLYLPILLAIATGMRRGEVLGLRWQDVDLDGEVLRVQQAAQRTQETGLVFKDPKGRKKGKRNITLPDFIIPALRKEKARQAELRLSMGPAWQVNDLVICQDDGTPRLPSYLSNTYTTLIKSLDLPRVTYHDLRHTSLSHLLKEGENILVVSERAGHANATITLKVYAHVLPEQHRESAARMARFMRRAVGDE
jgi:integrase